MMLLVGAISGFSLLFAACWIYLTWLYTIGQSAIEDHVYYVSIDLLPLNYGYAGIFIGLIITVILMFLWKINQNSKQKIIIEEH